MMKRLLWPLIRLLIELRLQQIHRRVPLPRVIVQEIVRDVYYSGAKKDGRV